MPNDNENVSKAVLEAAPRQAGAHSELKEHLRRVEQAGQRFALADTVVQQGPITDEALKELGDAYQEWVKARRAK